MLVMSSSDSEEDCYSNAALKLEKLKNAYKEDNIDHTSILNESSDVEILTEGKHKKQAPNSSCKRSVADKEDQDDLELEKLLSNSEKLLSNTSRRQTRYSTRNKVNHPIVEEILDISINNRTRSTRKQKQSLSNTLVDTQNKSTPGRGRKRGKGRGRRSRKSNNVSNDTPVISVGNTLEYDDQLEGQQLFSKPSNSNNVILIDDGDVLDENEELSVKVYWRSSECYPFKIRKFQKLTLIFKHFAEKENVSENNLLFMYNDRILKTDDTPDSINYNIAKFIDGGVINQDVTKLVNDKTKDNCRGIQIKFQCQNTKKPLEIIVQPNDKLSLAMIKCSEHLEMPLNRLKFEFDGDSITGTMTPKELELEGGECIDVKITS